MAKLAQEGTQFLASINQLIHHHRIIAEKIEACAFSDHRIDDCIEGPIPISLLPAHIGSSLEFIQNQKFPDMTRVQTLDLLI